MSGSILKPILSLGALDRTHDVSVTVYCPRRNKTFHVEHSMLFDFKHMGFPFYSDSEKNDITKKLFLYCRDQLGMGTEYDSIIVKLPCRSDLNVYTEEKVRREVHENLKFFSRFFKSHRVIDYVSTTHNELHSYQAFYNSGFTDAMCLSWDAGGDGCQFSTHGFKNKIIDYAKDYPYEVSWTYIWAAMKVIPFVPSALRSVQWHCYPLDLPGKIMGHSGYFKVRYPEYDAQEYRDFVDKTKSAMFSNEAFLPYFSDIFNVPEEEYGLTGIRTGKIKDYALKSEKEKMFYSSGIQQAFEEFIIDFFYKDEFYKVIKNQYGNNLCMSGGSSLNVLANEKIRKEFGFNVFVSPNPGDGGLSEGLLYHHIKSLGQEITPLGSRTNCFLKDKDRIPLPKKCLTKEEFCSLLKDGKIIGFLEGDVENGPRALGRRSILCDPSYPHMKDKINKNVKNREWYRPFAPVCKLEDAHIYFDRDRFDDLEFMSFAVNVKDEYKEQLSSITHVDGTARLQTVTKNQNPVLYEILDTFGGVLLNTSFNVSGKPILNSFESAMSVLNETELDYVVYYKHGQRCGDKETPFDLYVKNVDL